MNVYEECTEVPEPQGFMQFLLLLFINLSAGLGGSYMFFSLKSRGVRTERDLSSKAT